MNQQRLRYVITRPCLQSGTITLSRALEQAMPQDGPLVFVGEAGEEILASVDGKTRQVRGLADYFSRGRLAVNDMLYITPLGDRHFQLESINRNREETRPEARLTTPPINKRKQRVIGEETPYVREVREVRVSPYPKGLIYPQENQNQPETSETETLSIPASSPEVVLVAQPQQARAETKETNTFEARFSDAAVSPASGNPSLNSPTFSPTPPVTTPAFVPAEVDLQNTNNFSNNTETVSIIENTNNNTAPVVASNNIGASQIGNIGALQDCFETLGYDIKPVGGDRWLLTAQLGRRSYRVALITPMGGVSNEQWQALLDTAREHNAKYLAVAGRERLLAKLDPPKQISKLGRVDLDTLESLRELCKLAPLGPLEIEGYWNAGWIDQEAVESLRTTVSQRVQMRGLFSYVTLALGKFEAPGIVSMDELMEELEGSGVSREAVIGILASLAEPPFFAVAPLGDGEYYLRQPVTTVLSGVADYAASLKQHLSLLPNKQ